MWINRLKYEYEKKLASDAIGELEEEVSRLKLVIKGLEVIDEIDSVKVSDVLPPHNRELYTDNIDQLRQEAFAQQARSKRLTDMQSMQKHFGGLCGLGSGIESQRSNSLIGSLGL